jgi:glycerol-3-phosphate acyltransferase PlsY
VAALAFLPLFAAVNILCVGLEGTIGLWPMAAFAGAMVLLIVVKHRANIVRLLAGTENKIGRKEKE